MSDAKLGSWTVPESPIAIEYSLVVVEEIRREVTEGLQRLSRGGIEVGGVLYGVHTGESVRLLAVRPMVCEHARGPAFILSENDRAALAAQLKEESQDPNLKGFTCVGWFLSHTRGGVELTESDLDLYNSFFPEPWQVTLVIRPGRASSMRAGFFVREFDGAIQSERSYLEFGFPDRLGLAAVFERSPRAPAPGPDRRPAAPPVDTGGNAVPALHEYGAPAVTPFPSLEIETPKFVTAAPAAWKKWLWLVAWLAILVAGAVLGLRYFLPASRPEPIQLTVAEKDGVLQIEWNRAAKPVTAAMRGTLEIVDGTEPHTVSLTTSDLARGNFSYQRSTGDTEVRLTVEQSDGAKVQEASRFLGQPPPAKAPAEDVQALEQKRDELQAEVERLRKENSAQNTRLQQLERTVRILQTRLGNK
jgi:hypothetical protein